MNHSPWLSFARPKWPQLKTDLNCEVAIVGAGISGIATLYYLLTSTQKKVVLFEKNKVASGATGYNAGLAIAHIEKPASELVSLLGKEATRDFFNQLDEAWEALHHIHDEIGLKDNLLSFPHVANGFNALPPFLSFLKDTLIRKEDGATGWRYLVSENLKKEIPEELFAMIEFVPQQEILKTLKTNDTSYVAATVRVAPFQGKRMNSALFCYKLLDYLKDHFAHRFSVYEQTDITQITLYESCVVLNHTHGAVTAQKVILCTNAYQDFSIWDQMNEKPFTKLHDSIKPHIAYLAAFPSSFPQVGYALGFFKPHKAFKTPVWYFSYIPDGTSHACVLGGPEFILNHPYSHEWVDTKGELSLDLMKQFLINTFEETPKTFPYFWHGWMGYSTDGLRWVGPDSDYPHLWYNLACNGIGIVPAIAGAKKIAALMS